jgi:hypothetical protein
MAKGILYRKALRTDLTVKGGLVPIAFGADSVAFGFASPPRARPLSGRGQITTPSPRARSKPELSTLLGSGTFYFALTRAIIRTARPAAICGPRTVPVALPGEAV